MNSEIETNLRSYLQSGEKLRWVGAPAQGLRTSAQDVFLIPFSLLWGGFAIFWEASALRTGAPGFFDLWGIPFVVIGLYFIVGRFFVDAWVRSRTVYGLTDRRALLLRQVFSETLQAAGLDQNVTLRVEGGGRGTLEFGAQTSMFSANGRNGFSAWSPALAPGVRFIGIDKPKDVYRLAKPD